MKRMEEHLREALKGEVEVITATDLRKHPGECLTMSYLGKTYCIKRKGKVVGFLTLSADVAHEIRPDGSCDTLETGDALGAQAQRLGVR